MNDDKELFNGWLLGAAFGFMLHYFLIKFGVL